MRRKIFPTKAASALLATFALSAVGFSNAEPDIRRDAVVEAVAKVRPSVVNISTARIVQVQDTFGDLFDEFFGLQHRRPVEKRPMPFSLGSGVIIDDEGYILTNTHVVQRADLIGVLLGNDATDTNNIYDAKLIAKSETSDIALLKIDPKHGEKFPAIKFAKDDDLLVGETVIALGNPFGLGLSVSRGILSSTTRRPQPNEKSALDIQDWLQTDAAVNPGNSGGPLIDLRGELIGINNAVFRRENAQGISFAIPIKRVGETLSEIFTPENTGFWFGAKIKSDQGRLAVANVQSGSPAEKAGIRANDVIVKIGNKQPKNFIEFMVELVKRGGTLDVPLTIFRGGQERTVSARLVKEDTVFNAELIHQKLGLTVEAVTEKVAEALQVQPGCGLVITGIDKGSSAAAAGLQPGVIITGINDEPINEVRIAARKLHEKKQGDKVSLNLVGYQDRRDLFGRLIQVLVPGRADLKIR